MTPTARSADNKLVEILWEVQRRFSTYRCEAEADRDTDNCMVWISLNERRISGYRFALRAQAEQWARAMRSEYES